LSSSPAELLQQGPLIDILISATRFELDEGRAVGLDFPDWKVRALIDTGALCNNYQPANWQNLQTSTDQPRKNCSGWWRSGRVSGACGSNIISGIASAKFWWGSRSCMPDHSSAVLFLFNRSRHPAKISVDIWRA